MNVFVKSGLASVVGVLLLFQPINPSSFSVQPATESHALIKNFHAIGISFAMMEPDMEPEYTEYPTETFFIMIGFRNIIRQKSFKMCSRTYKMT